MNQREADHDAPFADVAGETPEQAAARVVSIGRARLLEWWSRAKNYTHPGTYGQSNTEQAGAIAYALSTGTAPRSFRNPTERDVRQHAARIAALAALTAPNDGRQPE